jgi:post-segregation antitoxin (ccd killing protein)
MTIDDETLAQARGLAPDGNLSALVNDALSERVRRERLRILLIEETATAGPDSSHPGRSRDEAVAILVLDLEEAG